LVQSGEGGYTTAGRTASFGAGNYDCWLVETRLTGDINGDGKVDMKDIGYVARRFMCKLGDPLWDPTADVNGDGKIDMKDIGTVAIHFGEHLL
jgi:hypothetical protein